MTTRRVSSDSLIPKLLSILKSGYSKSDFTRDLYAGILVGIVAFPLAIAFAIASGVKPEQGLYTAIVAGFVIAIFGGSRVQISGPTGAFIVVVYGVVQQYGYDGLAVATMMAGFMLIAMGLARLAVVMKFVSFPVTIGFTSGIALIIFSSELRDFFGLHILNMPADFASQIVALWEARHTISGAACSVSCVTLFTIAFGPKLTRRIPSPLLALIIATLFTHLFSLPVETVGARYGSVPRFLPLPHIPAMSFSMCKHLLQPAISLALLGAIESLLSATVSDGMVGGRTRSNMELVAQGIGNVVSPIFFGIPATGAIARTVTNVKAGGRTPISAIVHAATLLLILCCFAPLVSVIPLSALAAVLVFVAWNMSERRSFLRMFRSTKGDWGIMVTTFTLTVFVDLSVAIEVGIVSAALLFMRRMTDQVHIGSISQTVDSERDSDGDQDDVTIEEHTIPPEVEVYEVIGPLFFGVVDAFKNAIQITADKPSVLILRLRSVHLIDASGLHAVEDIYAQLKAEKITLIISGLREQPRQLFERSGFATKIGEQNICDDIDDALERSKIVVIKGALSDQWF